MSRREKFYAGQVILWIQKNTKAFKGENHHGQREKAEAQNA